MEYWVLKTSKTILPCCYYFSILILILIRILIPIHIPIVVADMLLLLCLCRTLYMSGLLFIYCFRQGKKSRNAEECNCRSCCFIALTNERI